MNEKSWGAILGEDWKCNLYTILDVIGAVVKQKFARNAPYGIDSDLTFEVISLFQKVQKCLKETAPF